MEKNNTFNAAKPSTEHQNLVLEALREVNRELIICAGADIPEVVSDVLNAGRDHITRAIRRSKNGRSPNSRPQLKNQASTSMTFSVRSIKVAPLAHGRPNECEFVLLRSTKGMNWGHFQENQRHRGGHIYFALLAKWLRQHPTEAESRMWQILKTRPQGYTFRRQQPLLWRIADFYCVQLRLVVEVDGGWHQHRKGPDGITNRKYTTHGIHILRFKNGQVLFRPEKVMEILDTFIRDISSPICESSGTVGRCLIADFMIDDDGHEFALL